VHNTGSEVTNPFKTITHTYTQDSNSVSMPQLLMNTNDMRKAEIRSGSQVCVGSALPPAATAPPPPPPPLVINDLVKDEEEKAQVLVGRDEPFVMVATAWPSAEVKVG
jgi:hypothetical protein